MAEASFLTLLVRKRQLEVQSLYIAIHYVTQGDFKLSLQAEFLAWHWSLFSLYGTPQAGSSDCICVWTPIHRRAQGSEDAEKFSTSKFWTIQVTPRKKSICTISTTELHIGFSKSETSQKKKQNNKTLVFGQD